MGRKISTGAISLGEDGGVNSNGADGIVLITHRHQSIQKLTSKTNSQSLPEEIADVETCVGLRHSAI